MALQFGVGKLTASGVVVGRIHNVTINVTYDNAQMRGDNRVFADNTQFFNGAIEGSWEWGDLQTSGLHDLLGGTGTFAGGSGTWVISATQWPKSGISLVFSGVTDGITCCVTLQSIRVPSLTLKFDRENYLLPAANFIAQADSAGKLISIQQ